MTPRPLPEHLVLFVTDRCQAECLHCFKADELNRGADLLTAGELAALAAAAGPLRTLSLSGGEPLLRDDLEDVVAPFAVRNVGEVFVPTNGLLPERARRFAESLLTAWPGLRLAMSVSIDGPADLHDRIRGVAGAFGRALETARGLLELAATPPGRRLRVKVGTVIARQNVDAIPPLLDRVAGDLPGLDFHDVEVLRGRPLEGGLEPPTAEQLRSLAPRVLRAWRRYRFFGRGAHLRSSLAGAVKAYNLLLSVEVLERGNALLPCRAPWTTLVVGEEGDASFCELGPQIGSVRSAPLSDVWTGSEASRVRDEVARGACSCVQSCHQQRSLAASPRLWPRILLHAVTGHFVRPRPRPAAGLVDGEAGG